MGLKSVAVIAGLCFVGYIAVTGFDDPVYVVDRVVDGDTIEVVEDGTNDIVTVRLLNVDTPEMVSNDPAERCYSKEAKAFLEDILPQGSRVTLETDRDSHDRYDRLLAGVRLANDESESLINAEIARQGYGVAVLFEPNDKFYSEVKAAEREAARENLGIHDPKLGCSYTGRVQAMQEEMRLLSEVALADLETPELDSHLASLAALHRATKTFSLTRDSDSAIAEHYQLLFTPDHGSDLEALKDEIRSQREDVENEKAERAAEEERKRAEEREAKEKAAKEEQERKAEAARQAELAQQEEERRRIAESQPAPAPAAPKPAPAPAPAPKANTGGSSLYSGPYNGCRAYGGKYAPNAIDAQGRPYTRIHCDTKLPR